MTCYQQIKSTSRTTGRSKLRIITAKYNRTARDQSNIMDCLSRPDQVFGAAAIGDPLNPEITKMVCKALYRRMQYCKTQGPRMLTAYICAREFYACECETYRKQTAAQRAIPHHLFNNVISIGLKT